MLGTPLEPPATAARQLDDFKYRVAETHLPPSSLQINLLLVYSNTDLSKNRTHKEALVSTAALGFSLVFKVVARASGPPNHVNVHTGLILAPALPKS